VFKAIKIIEEVQTELGLLICPLIKLTSERLRFGCFKVMTNDTQAHKEKYHMDYGLYIPPKTIMLDSNLPTVDKPMNLPDLATTLTMYTAIHETIHADDYTEGNSLLLKTMRHITEQHEDKLTKGMSIIRRYGGSLCIRNMEDLASLWAMQYVDVLTHYRSYIILRHKNYPQLDHIWTKLSNDYFPPNLFTTIERHKNIDYVFNLFTHRKGDFCFVEALEEYNNIKQKQILTYTV
jgi:hypothetical protein